MLWTKFKLSYMLLQCMFGSAVRQGWRLKPKVFRSSFEYWHFHSPKVAIFAEKKQQNCITNVLSNMWFTENIEVQPELDPCSILEYPTVTVRRRSCFKVG